MENTEHLRRAGLENPTPPHNIGASGQSSLPDQSVNVSSPGHKPGKRSHADTMHVARLQKREAVALQGSRSVTSIECYFEREKSRLCLFKHFYADKVGAPEFPEKLTMAQFHARYLEFSKGLELCEEDETPTEDELLRRHVEAEAAFQKKFIKE